MKLTWKVDDATVVEAQLRVLGKETIRVNGQQVHDGRRIRGRGIQ